MTRTKTRRGVFSSSSFFWRGQVSQEAGPYVKQEMQGGVGVVADGGEDALRRGREAKSLISGACDFDFSPQTHERAVSVLLSTITLFFNIALSGAVGG